MAIQAAMR